MKTIGRLTICAVAFLFLLGGFASPCTADPGHCVVATVQPLATDAGLNAYRDGGNAVDAAIAAALTLGVVDTYNSGIGGGCFILIRSPDGSFLAIDGRETAPVAATSDMFVRDGKARPELSTTGPLAVGVPGALAAYSLALQKVGNRPLADLLLPAAKIADRGFVINQMFAQNLRSKADSLAQFAGSRAVLFGPDRQPYGEGEILRQPDLAATYRSIAAGGIDWFYRGPFADSIGRWMSENGGILAASDFADYRPVERKPVITTYRDWQIVGFPPPSSGGIHVAQMLNMLETFDLSQRRRQNHVDAAHLMIEAMKLAFADRAHWLGDADFANVPLGLIDKRYGQSLARRIHGDRSSTVPSHGDPSTVDDRFFERHTTHIAAADSEGYWVAITATINTHFGSKVIVPATGVMLNNEMDDFASQPGVPNAFGLIGAENNAVAARKRPLSSMSPTIVLDRGGKPVMSVGAAGGPKIITQVLLAIVRHLDYGQSLRDALAQPRFHHQWRPDRVLVEETADREFIRALEARGHQVTTGKSVGVSQAIGIDVDGNLHGVHDPRVPGKVGLVHRTEEL